MAFCSASLNVRPMAMASPTDFIWVVSVGSVSGSGLRPPPGRRTRVEGSTPASTSATASCTVERDMPVTRATMAMPPRPNARASAPATMRRCRSSRWGITMESFLCNASSVTSTRRRLHHPGDQTRVLLPSNL